jgi:hypothetical protein
MIEPHHEADDEENQTNDHEELFAVMVEGPAGVAYAVSRWEVALP